jgi:hypothetical protein
VLQIAGIDKFLWVTVRVRGEFALILLVPHRRCRPTGDETGVLQFSLVLLNLHFCFFIDLVSKTPPERDP